MSQTTKRALAQSLKHLMAQKPLSKITIADITEDCGINRMTFYYHFQDIYDLIEWICLEGGRQAIQGKTTYQNWQEGFIALCRATLDNRVFVEGVTHSLQREYVQAYLLRMVYRLLYDVVEELSQGYGLSQESKEYITNFYKYAFVGVMMEWVQNGMKESPETLAAKLSRMTRGQLLLSIQNEAEAHV